MERILGPNALGVARSNRRSSSLPGTMKLWQHRIQSRRQLAHLDSRLLVDVGISEARHYIELNKPFWR